MAAIETVPFAGTTISRLIKGGWQLHEHAGSLDRAVALRDMHAFADAGINVFETADSYRGVERLVGAFLAERPDRIRVHTRLTVPTDGAVTAARTREAVAAACRNLGVDRLDLLQLSMWRFERERWRAAADHVAAFHAEGIVESIGVMNVDDDEIDRLVHAGVPLVSAQAQLSLIDRRAQRTLLPACRKRGLAFFGYGALAGGLLSHRWLARPDPGIAGAPHPEYRAMIDAFGGWALFQRLLTVLAAIAARHSVDIGTIALRWALDQQGVTAMLVGARDAAHLPQLLRLGSIRLDAEDLTGIDTVLDESRGPRGPVGGIERDPAGALARAIAARR